MDDKNSNTDPKVPEKMSFEEAQEMFERAIISDDSKLQKEAWEILNRNDGEMPWMRMGIIMKAYEAADAKGKEEFFMINMRNAIQLGNAVELKETFTDPDANISYRQYKMSDGKISRVPVVTSGMGKYEYDIALNKKFLGDVIESMSTKNGKIEVVERFVLDTKEKVDDYNAGGDRWLQKWVVKNPNPKYLKKD